MIWIVICVLIMCYVDSKEKEENQSRLTSIIWGIILGLCFYFTFGFFIGFMAEKEYTESETKALYALEDGSNLQGSFFLASGYVDGEPVIKYITDGEFGKEIKTVETDDCYIKETDGEICLKLMKSKFKHKWVKLFTPWEEFDKYVFYVPNGSVINQYNIDLQ